MFAKGCMLDNAIGWPLVNMTLTRNPATVNIEGYVFRFAHFADS